MRSRCCLLQLTLSPVLQGMCGQLSADTGAQKDGEKRDEITAPHWRDEWPSLFEAAELRENAVCRDCRQGTSGKAL